MPGVAVATKLNSIRRHANLKNFEIADLVDVEPQTISRWQAGQTDPHSVNLQSILTLDWLTDLLAEYYEPDEARLWLYSQTRLLSGERPADRIRRGDTESVLALIEQLSSGAFV
jgi:transcriptional regulator with XRE-family HTH domain